MTAGISRLFENALHWRTHLVIGGARSGKTAYGMRLAVEHNLDQWMIATAEAGDAEMRERISRHRAERGANWQVVEEPVALVDALARTAAADRVVVVDCLTIWLSNWFLRELDYASELERLAAWLQASSSPVILISNELGMGLVPETSLGRGFRDAHGRMNQSLAAICDCVTFVAAGLPLVLKSHHRF